MCWHWPDVSSCPCLNFDHCWTPCYPWVYVLYLQANTMRIQNQIVRIANCESRSILAKDMPFQLFPWARMRPWLHVPSVRELLDWSIEPVLAGLDIFGKTGQLETCADTNKWIKRWIQCFFKDTTGQNLEPSPSHILQLPRSQPVLFLQV